MKILGTQVESCQQLTSHQDLGVWKPTAVGSLVADVRAIKAAGGSRRVTLPNSTLRIADLKWAEVKDVEGRVMCWQRTIAGVRVLIRNNSPTEEEMTKSTQDTPQASQPVTPKDRRVPKPIAFEPQGEIKAVKAGTKLASLIDALATGVTIEELATELSRTGSKVDAAAARSWLSYDLRRVGLGVKEVEGRLHLLGTPLPHKVAEPKKAPEAKAVEPQAAEPALQIIRKKRAAGSSKPKSKKAKASVK